MKHIDSNFPIIEYTLADSSLIRGQKHGEQFREHITTLCQTRKELMLAKNPAIANKISQYAKEQLESTRHYSAELASELEGLAAGANTSVENIIILNNYTDFRDIQLPDEGCSTIYSKLGDNSIAGQTWDMHSSAKNYVCVLKIPHRDGQFSYLFSLTGCLGMMGVNPSGLFLGVNNINTLGARNGVIWPALVRLALEQENLDDLRKTLQTTNVTSGHNYLIANSKQAEHWEISPRFQDRVSTSTTKDHIFHTNHCLSDKADTEEDKNSISSTTHARHEILENGVDKIKNSDHMIALLKSHKGFPKSICSHFESGAQDPSMTCGGAVYDFNSKVFHLWRGCQEHDKNYVEYNISL